MFTSNHTIVFGFALLSELRKTLQKQEEETKQREKNIDELQNKNESLKNDLTKADKERKELAHKVGAGICASLGAEGGMKVIRYRLESLLITVSCLLTNRLKVYPLHFVFHPGNSPFDYIYLDTCAL